MHSYTCCCVAQLKVWANTSQLLKAALALDSLVDGVDTTVKFVMLRNITYNVSKGMIAFVITFDCALHSNNTYCWYYSAGGFPPAFHADNSFAVLHVRLRFAS
jgi:hypothetical protein